MNPILQATSLAIVALLAFAPGSVFAADRKPNVVILYADDMGYGEPSCYGGKLARTPHIDSIGKNGVRFTDGY
jgi:hypothetical protein